MHTMIFRVVESESGRPVANAAVRVSDPEQAYRTDGEGSCNIEFQDEEEERLALFVRKEGFVPMRVIWNRSRKAVMLPGEYTLNLERGTRIGGTVKDDSGEPIGGATVFLWMWAPRTLNGAEVNPDVMDCTVVTDAGGKWSFEQAPSELPDVGYRLMHRDFVEELYSRKAADPAQLRDGTAVWEMQRGVRLEGVVTGVEGQPVEGAQILPGKDRMCGRSDGLIRTDGSGRFSIPLCPGKESLTIKAEGYAPGLLDLDVWDGMEPLRVQLELGRVLRGRVVDTGGNPLPGTHVFADTWRRHRTLTWLTLTDEEGRFTWTSAPPDEVLFDILRAGYRGRRRVPMIASGEERQVVLCKAFWVGGTVRDAATGAPVEAFRVIPGYTHDNGPINWLRERGVDFTGGNYEWQFKGDMIDNRVLFLRVEAEGFLSGVSRIDDAGRAITIDFGLESGPATRGCLLKPDGTPANHARLVVISANPAALRGEKLDPGHGNMEITAAGDGTFWFPPQEPPYAILAVHAEGCLFAMAEDLAMDPVLRLQAWGRLEILSDGAAAEAAAIPFYLHYSLQGRGRPQAPGNPRRLPWLNLQPEGKRVAPNRIVFEMLMPGPAIVGRTGTPGRNAIDVLVTEGKTTTLDFDRGPDGTGEKVPGTCVVKVIDENDLPVGGAMVTARSFSLKAPRGTSVTRSISTEPPCERVTNRHGVVVLRYPTTKDEVKSVNLRVGHPDFCTEYASVPDVGEALPVVLRRGGTVRVVGAFEEDGRSPDRIYAQMISDEKHMTDPDTWVREEPGALSSTRVPPGSHTLRVACFPAEGAARFSDAANLQVAAGQVLELRLALKAGKRFAGKLDESVPRPVLDGHVDLNVVAGGGNADHPLDWRAHTDIAPDGSFVFESLPQGPVQLIAFCDGYVSKSPDAVAGWPSRKPHTFESPPGAGIAVVAMEPAATVRVHVADEKGRPVAGARAHLNPNVTWAGRQSGIFGIAFATEEVLRMGAEARRKGWSARGRGHRFLGLTDELGAVIIPNVPAGKQTLLVITKGYEPAFTSSHESGMSRQEIKLSPGEVRDVRVIVRQPKAGGDSDPGDL